MGMWTMIAVIVVAGVIGEILKTYFKSQGNAQKVSKVLDERLQDYQQEMDGLKKRIRNLETIAATSPEDFQGASMSDADDFDFESTDEFNEKLVNQLSRKKQKGR
jgi:hypothetical protein